MSSWEYIFLLDGIKCYCKKNQFNIFTFIFLRSKIIPKCTFSNDDKWRQICFTLPNKLQSKLPQLEQEHSVYIRWIIINSGSAKYLTFGKTLLRQFLFIIWLQYWLSIPTHLYRFSDHIWCVIIVRGTQISWIFVLNMKKSICLTHCFDFSTLS